MGKHKIKKITHIFLILLGCFLITSCQSAKEKEWVEKFKNPPNSIRPQPFWHINGEMTKEGVYEQITDAYKKDGFGGVAILPLTEERVWGEDAVCPGTTPEYLSEEYFDRYKDILDCSNQLGTYVILYDDVNFPSGTMGGKLIVCLQTKVHH